MTLARRSCDPEPFDDEPYIADPRVPVVPVALSAGLWPPRSPAERLNAIDLANAHYQRPGQLDAEIWRHYRVSTIRFWQEVNTMLTDPDLLAARPVAVNRLLRLRTRRRSSRTTVLTPGKPAAHDQLPA